MDKLEKPSKTPGIYAIYNSLNGKLYIGKTNNLRRRFTQYKNDYLKRRTNHINDYLMRAFDKSGFDNFEFFQVESCEENQLSEKELFWILQFNSINRDFGYNLRLDSSSGMLASPETRAKISKNLTQQWASGIRKDHGKKLKANWKSNDGRKEQQALVMKRNLTKYIYKIQFPNGEIRNCEFKELQALGLESAMSVWHRKGDIVAKLKDHFITKIRLGNES